MALEFSEELGLQADLSVEGSILRYLPSLLVQLKIYRACFLPEYRLYITLQAVECHSIATERRLSLRSKTIFGVSTAVTELKQKEKKKNLPRPISGLVTSVVGRPSLSGPG